MNIIISIDKFKYGDIFTCFLKNLTISVNFMKNLAILLLMFLVTGTAVPSSFASAKDKITVSINENAGIYKKAARVSKKKNKEKKKDTKRRVNKLEELGIDEPKSYLNYGKDLSLEEFGKIIGAWIVDFWVSTGQLPGKLTDDPPDWLMVNVNGTCYSASNTCDRWVEE